MRFVIPGKPFGKQRPKVNFKARTVRTPAETVSFERTVGQYAMAAGVPLIEKGVGVKLTFIAVFEPAPSWTKKKTAALLFHPHTQKPDLDNIEKAIKDGLNRIAYVDDSQVAQVSKRKMWGHTAETIVTVERLEKFDLRGA